MKGLECGKCLHIAESHDGPPVKTTIPSDSCININAPAGIWPATIV